MWLLKCALILVPRLSTIASGTLYTPTAYTLSGVSSANGSSQCGGCPSECIRMLNGIPVCECPSKNTTGFLIDGVSPMLNVSETNTWASALYTTYTDSNTFDLGFRFQNTLSLRGVELFIFYCPDWSIGPHTIEVRFSFGFPIISKFRGPDGIITLNKSQQDCNSLTRVVISTPDARSGRIYFIEFNSSLSAAGIYIADVRFSNESFPTNVTSTVTGIPSSTTLASTEAQSSQTVHSGHNTVETSAIANTVMPETTFTTADITSNFNFNTTTATVPPSRSLSPLNSTVIVVPVIAIIIIGVAIFIISLTFILGRRRCGQSVLSKKTITIRPSSVEMDSDSHYETIRNGKVETMTSAGEDNHYECITECREMMTSIKNEAYGYLEEGGTIMNEAYGSLEKDHTTKNEAYGYLEEGETVKNEAYGCLQKEAIVQNQAYGCLQEGDIKLISNDAYSSLPLNV